MIRSLKHRFVSREVKRNRLKARVVAMCDTDERMLRRIQAACRECLTRSGRSGGYHDSSARTKESRSREGQTHSILEALAIGEKVPGFKCNCGALHHGPGTVFAVEPGGKRFFYQVAGWWSWRVKIRDDDAVFDHETDYSYVCGFEFFGEEENGRQLFDEAFAEVDADKLFEEYNQTQRRVS